jgi:hypothetical protein
MPEDVARYRDTPALVIALALREGRVISAADAPAACRSARVAQPLTRLAVMPG